ncbi:MAG: AmmeMemoRadiSam system protein B [Kiritimatiellae bacterium]|nr:AmmeMemoRadiSam system protein B [Kiritimatiellia bacterium]
MKTLQSTLAGGWYPGTEQAIRERAAQWEGAGAADEATPPSNTNVIILPHAGWDYSGRTAWRAVRLVRDARFRRVVILAPSHRAWIENRLVAPESDAVSTPLGEIRIDKDWLNSFELLAPVQRNDRIHLAEHSAQIEFPLLQLALGKDFTIVPLILGAFDPDQMAMCARALSRLMDSETLLVISSDFTHYGADFEYAPYGTGGGEDVRERVASVDAEAFALLAKGDADGFAAYVGRTGATICGRIPLEMALRAFPAGTSLVRLVYATSADQDRDFTRFVCYTAAAGHVEWKDGGDEVLDADARAFLLRVARESLEHGVRTGRAFPHGHFTPDAPKSTLLKMGAFVTLNDKATGALRGCIGEILPMRPLVEAVAERAVDSALHDPRFMPVEESELGNLRVEVSALTPPKPVASWRDIVLGRDGMTLEKDGCFAVFLPQVAPEQGWDLPTTLSYLAQKAGLSSNAWRTGATFETFQAEVFHE